MNPPVLLLGGLANALSLCRSFGRMGIPVTVCASRRSPAHWSRFCRLSLMPKRDERVVDFWEKVLIQNVEQPLAGSILLACNDEAIEFIAKREHVLKRSFILEPNPGPLRLDLLNKKKSIEIAKSAGLLVPKSLIVSESTDVERCLDKMQLPILVRPVVSHKFSAVFGRKLILCKSRTEVISACDEAFAAGIDVTLCEYIPGPDSQLCSYYTYMDESGEPLFKFTKRVVRRHPYNFGEGSYHQTDWIPDVAEVGQRFFSAANLRGLGNVEFKRDPRDGTLKFIECNARFTAAHEILVKSNFDIGRFVYGELAGRPYALPQTFIRGVSMSVAFRDFRAWRQLSKKGELPFREWLKQTWTAEARPYFQWSDPLPAVRRIESGLRYAREYLRSRV